MEHKLPHTALSVRRVYVKDKKELFNEILEGEVPMSQEQQDYYKSIIGDGNCRVSVGRDLSESNYGSGGKVFVSVSLVCDQSGPTMNYAIELASQMAGYHVEKHLREVQQKCVQLGLLEPKMDPNAKPQY